MAERVLRLTRHPAGEDQLKELRRLYGADVAIVEIAETVSGAVRVAELVKGYEATVLEAVLPLPILAEVINPRSGVNVPVIRASMVRHVAEDSTATFTFSHYERIVRVEVQVERL